MVESSRGQKAGQPRKHANGWGSANARIYLSKESFELWRKLQKERDFLNDDSMAKYLLSLYRAPPSSCSAPWAPSSIMNERAEHSFPYCGRLVNVVIKRQSSCYCCSADDPSLIMDRDQSPGNRNAAQIVPLTSTPRRNSRIKLMYGDVFSEERERFS